MNDYSIEFLPEQNSLQITIEGPIQIDSFPQLYTSVLAHPDFKKNRNLLWNALSSSITNISVKDLKKTFYCVKETESQRGKSCSAWVFTQGDNYEAACLFKSAFAAGLKIRYGVFTNLDQAKDWLQGKETPTLKNSSII